MFVTVQAFQSGLVWVVSCVVVAEQRRKLQMDLTRVKDFANREAK